MLNYNPLTIGTVAGVPLVADLSRGIAGPVITVLMTADYSMLAPPGWPTRPSLIGVPVVTNRSAVVSAGSTFAFYKCEADALVTAGAATYV